MIPSIIPKTSPCKISEMVLDVVTSEGVEIGWETSEYKLQSGFTASCVRIKSRVRLNLECVFVDNKLGLTELFSTAAGGLLTTWREKYEALKDLANTEDIVTVTLGLDVFPNMTVKNVGIIRDEKRAGYLSFSLALEEMPVVDIDFESVDNSLMPKDGEPEETKKADDKKKKKPDKGKSEPKKAAEPERASTLYGMAY